MLARRRQAADDELFRLHSRYLGPPGFTLPFSIPYRGILPGAAAAFAVLVVTSLLGAGIWRFVIVAGAFIAVAALADRYSGSERPVSSLPAIISHETGAPRPHAPEPARLKLRPQAVPVHQPRRGVRGGGTQ
jgi:hypothetical protein